MSKALDWLAFTIVASGIGLFVFVLLRAMGAPTFVTFCITVAVLGWATVRVLTRVLL